MENQGARSQGYRGWKILRAPPSRKKQTGMHFVCARWDDSNPMRSDPAIPVLTSQLGGARPVGRYVGSWTRSIPLFRRVRKNKNKKRHHSSSTKDSKRYSQLAVCIPYCHPDDVLHESHLVRRRILVQLEHTLLLC